MRWSARNSHDELNRKLEHQHEMLHQIKEGIHDMSAAFDRLTQEVAETKAAVAEAVAKIAELAQAIKDNTTDPAAVSALADELDATQKALADAINPPVPEPEPPVEPTA